MLRLNWIIGFAALMLNTGFAAQAQELPRPEIEAKEITVGGVLVGCSLEFLIAFRDQVYKGGAPAGTTGSINLWHQKDKLYSSLKMVGVDFIGSEAHSFKIAQATLFNGNGSPTTNVATACDNPNDFCALMPADAFVSLIASIAMKGRVRLAFNRSEGGMDVPIELPVGLETLRRLMNCTEKLSGGGVDRN